MNVTQIYPLCYLCAKNIKVGENLPKLWQNNFAQFLWDTVYIVIRHKSSQNKANTVEKKTERRQATNP